METGSHAIANPTMWKAVEIILGIALVTPENITDQFAEAVLTWIPGSKYNACCVKVMYAAHKKSWWVQQTLQNIQTLSLKGRKCPWNLRP